jgi:hypothetical protein
MNAPRPLVMAGLRPGHLRLSSSKCPQDVDARHKAGHDEPNGKARMHRFLACILIAALAAPALAQDQPKSLKTVRIREPAPGSPNLYVIDEDGTVRIDWPAVETLAASKADRTVLPLTQLMLAIRDGTWKPAR